MISYFRYSLLLFASAVCGTAAAWDSEVRIPSGLDKGDYVIDRLARADATGYWSSGHVGSLPASVRYDFSGNVLAMRYEFSSGGSSSLFAAANGSVYRVDDGGALEYVDAQGIARWSGEGYLSDVNEPPATCPLLVLGNLLSPDADGAWLAVRNNDLRYVARCGNDGLLASFASFDEIGVEIAALQGDGAAHRMYVAGVDATAHAAVAMLDAQSQVRWRWQSPDSASSLTALAATDSAAFAAGTRATAAGNRLYVVSADANGSDVRAATLDVPADRVYGVAASANGARYVLSANLIDSLAFVYLRGLDANNAVVWTQFVARCAASAIEHCGNLKVDAAGRVVAFVSPVDTDTQHARVSRFGEDGAATGSALVPYSTSDDWTPLPDGSVVIAGPSASCWSIDGAALPAPKTAALFDTATTSFIAAPQGGAYQLAQDASTHRSVLTRIDAQGAVLWQRGFAGSWIGAPQFAWLGSPLRFDASTRRVCIIGYFSSNGSTGEAALDCLRSDTGAPIWHREIGSRQVDGYSVALRVLEDDSIVLLRQSDTYAAEYRRIAANGDTLAFTPYTGHAVSFMPIGINARGELAMLKTTDAITHFVRIDAAGVTAVDVPWNATAGGAPRRSSLGEDGVGILVRDSQDAALVTSAQRVDSSGVVAWNQALFTGQNTDGDELLADGDTLFYGTTQNSGVAYFTGAKIARFSASTGAVAWVAQIPYHTGYVLRWAGGGQADPVAVLPGADRLFLHRFDRATGATKASAVEDCGAYCELALARNLDDQHIGVLVKNIDAHNLPQVQWLTRRLVTESPVALDQHALAGAWWAPYERGQGFMLDVLTDSHTFFMPWFTYTAEGGNDPAQLRWYTIQGDIPPGARTATFNIVDTRGGGFDASQPYGVSIAGFAVASFSDCDHGTLHYRFGLETATAEGDITLSRLMPRTESCTLADGTTQAPLVAPAPAQGGFDTRMSGSWYEPPSAGQGVQFSIQPGGILFGAWFTYDPVGAADDASAQHWFTLQGSLANATNGVATVAIAQAIGGSFDALPTDNQYAVGSATLTLNGCDRMQVDYHFDAKAEAGAYGAKSGTLELVKIGGCVP